MPTARSHHSVLAALATTAGLGATVGVPSCASEEPVATAIAARFTAPRAVLDKARRLEIRVFEGQITCDATTGKTTGAETAREIARRELGTQGCAEGIRFCGDLSIDKSDATRIFEAKAQTDNGDVLAIGCAEAKVDRDALPLTIKMFRYLAPANCGDGIVQPTEQCEPGGSELCSDTCQSEEQLLSVGSAGNNTKSGVPGDKTDPFFLWPAQGGTAGRFFALYTDKAVDTGGNNIDVGLRVMSDDLSPVTSPPALASGSILLPNGGSFPPQASPNRQSLPQAAFLRGKYYVVFQDDASPGSAGLDIHLRSLNDVLQSEQGAEPLFVNGSQTEGEAAIQTAPSIAAGNDRLFVVWEDQGQQKIAGRTLTPPSTFGNQNDISTGTGNSRPQVAKVGTGWVAVWKSGTGIKLRRINADGTPQGAEQLVSDGSAAVERPSVASLDDGRFAVTWSSSGDIWIQRYDAKGAKVAGDQNQPVNDIVSDGEQVAPWIASTPASGGSYALAWSDLASGHIRGRFLGGSAGYLFNNVNGQATEFQASGADGRERATPVVVAGGTGPFVAIGWEDRSSPNSGIVVRRFPLPSE